MEKTVVEKHVNTCGLCHSFIYEGDTQIFELLPNEEISVFCSKSCRDDALENL